MNEIIVKTQEELDKVDINFRGRIYIHGGTYFDMISVSKTYPNAYVVARGSSHVVAWGSSHIEARESSHVEARESVSVTSLSSMVEVTLFFFAVCINKAKSKVIKKSKTCTEIKVPEMKGSFLEYQQEYPVKVKGKIATMYKAVHKYEDGTYHADYNKDYVYEIGKEYTEKCSPKESGSCSEGLHLAHKSWAKSFGIGWSDMALLECEVNIKDIVVSKDTDGKLRASKIKIIREVPKSEY